MVLSSWSVGRSKRNRKLIMKIGVPLSGSGYPLIRSAPVRPRQGRAVGCAATPGVLLRVKLPPSLKLWRTGWRTRWRTGPFGRPGATRFEPSGVRGRRSRCGSELHCPIPLLIPKGSQPIAGRLRTSGTTPPVLCFSGRILEGSQASASDEPCGRQEFPAKMRTAALSAHSLRLVYRQVGSA